MIVDCLVLEVIDLMEEDPKPRTEIKHEKGVTKYEPSEKQIDVILSPQKEETESKIEIETKVSTNETSLEVFSSVINKTCKATSTNYSKKHRSSQNNSVLFIPLSTNKYEMEEPKTDVNLASQVGIKRKNEARNPHPDASSPTYPPSSTAKYTAKIPAKPPPHLSNPRKLIIEVDLKSLWEKYSYCLVF